MDESTSVTAAAEWMKLIGATGIGGLVMAFFAKFAFRKMIEEDTATQRAGGETDIIEQLRAEVDRLSAINERLSAKLSELQDQIVKLRSENADLKAEIQALNIQIRSLRNANQ